jgi:hypothetical protein
MTISDSNTNHFDVAEFERNRELWTSKNIQHYKMIIGAEGFMMNFPEEVLIEVRTQRATSIKSLSKTGKNATDTYRGYNTVEKLFSFVDSQRKRGTKNLWVTYDTGYGYPTRIEVDQDGHYGNDDELLLEVKVSRLSA